MRAARKYDTANRPLMKSVAGSKGDPSRRRFGVRTSLNSGRLNATGVRLVPKPTVALLVRPKSRQSSGSLWYAGAAQPLNVEMQLVRVLDIEQPPLRKAARKVRFALQQFVQSDAQLFLPLQMSQC